MFISAVSGLGTLFISDNLKTKVLLFSILFLNLLLNKNQKVIVQNKDDLKLLEDWGVLKSEKVKLVKGSGVRLEDFVNLDEPDGIITICLACRLLKDKGVFEFRNAARKLKEKGINAKFLLAGDLDIGNPESLNEHDLNIIKEEGYVEILGHCDDIPKLYHRSHIVCLPSYREGLPKV